VIRDHELYDLLVEMSLDFFAGVPDSLLAPLIDHIDAVTPAGRHVVAANEGNAVALAAGHTLGTGRPGVVYLQNSGLGNCVNPLLSLCAEEALGIPVLLLVGWRGEPGRPDAAQHRRQGAVTLPLLEAMGLAHRVLPDTLEGARQAVEQAVTSMRITQAPYALVIPRGTVVASDGDRRRPPEPWISREEAIRIVVSTLDPATRFVATTGKTARELYALREAAHQPHHRDLSVAGSMGHASSVAHGFALARPDHPVCCLDGDGALLMHMGALATVGRYPPPNLLHVVLDNQAHDSVGGVATASANLDVPALARACGYLQALSASTAEQTVAALGTLERLGGPTLLHLRVARGARTDLGRPDRSPRDQRSAFVDGLDS
jgi:phosphonopyruvate decarboxylase